MIEAVEDAVVVSDAAQVINARHAELVETIEALKDGAMTALHAAVSIGGLLMEAKDVVEHGGWIPWVEEQLDFKPRQAQNYMKAWRNRDRMLDGEVSSMAEGLRLLTEPEDAVEKTSLSLVEPKSELELLQDQVQRVVGSMHGFGDRAENILSGSSPRAGQHLITAMRAMLSQLVTWLPDGLGPCPECDGAGVAPDPDGVMVHCGNCFGGKTGRYRA
jgi:hypothetical protein